MFYKKTLLIIFCFCCITISHAKIADHSLLMFFDINNTPFYYESTDKMYSFGISGNIGSGYQYKKFYFKVNHIFNYQSFDGQLNDNIDIGFFEFNTLVNLGYVFNNYLKMSWGLGGAYLRNVVYKSTYDLELKSLGGLSTNTILNIKPCSFFYIDIINNLEVYDLFNFTSSEYKVLPKYTGMVRGNFNPYLRWVNLYSEIGVQYFNYTYEDNIYSKVMFKWGVGISLKLKITDDIEYMKGIHDKVIKYYEAKKKKQTDDKVYTSQVGEQENDNGAKESYRSEEIETDKALTLADELKLLEINDSKLIKGILFDNNSEPLESSRIVLNFIYKYLIDMPETVITIEGYSKFFGNPILETQNSVMIAIKVKNYLIKKGINEDRIKISNTGKFYYENKDPLITLSRGK